MVLHRVEVGTTEGKSRRIEEVPSYESKAGGGDDGSGFFDCLFLPSFLPSAWGEGCVCHYGSPPVEHEILAANPISTPENLKIVVHKSSTPTEPDFTATPGGSKFLGYYGASDVSEISLGLLSVDLDSDVCEPGQSDVYAILQGKEDELPVCTVKRVEFGIETQIDSFPLELEGDTWVGSWICGGEPGVYIFELAGTIEDRHDDHPQSDDEDLTLSPYRSWAVLYRVDSIDVIPKGMSPGDVSANVSIAAGGIASPAHQADVTIQVSPDVAGIPVGVGIDNGRGHAIHATLTVGSTVAVGGEAAVAMTTGNGGEIAGVLQSSDSLDVCIIRAGGAHRSVAFTWDEVEEEGEWVTDQEWLPIPGVLKNWLRLRHHRKAPNGEPWAPLSGHGIRMFVEKVEYWDETGELLALTNTPEHPLDVSDWATFPEEPIPTDGDGVVRIDLHVWNNDNLHSLLMVAYDWSVHREPGASPTPLATVQAIVGQVQEADSRSEFAGTKGGGREEFKPVVDLVGKDAITGREVPEQIEESLGVRVQIGTIPSSARLVVRSVKKPGYQRRLALDAHGIPPGDLEIRDLNGNKLPENPIDHTIQIPGSSEEDVTLVIARISSWNPQAFVMVSLLVAKGAESLQPDKVKLVPLKIEIGDYFGNLLPVTYWHFPSYANSNYRRGDFPTAIGAPGNKGTFKWDIAGQKGFGAMGIVTPQGSVASVTKTDDPRIQVFSRGYSDAKDDILLKLTYTTPDGAWTATCEEKLTVLTFELSLAGVKYEKIQAGGWSTYRDMDIVDQIVRQAIPHPVDINEEFVNWQSLQPENWTAPQAFPLKSVTCWTDWIYKPRLATDSPQVYDGWVGDPTQDPLAQEGVDRATQIWRYGSEFSGKGDVFLRGNVTLQRNLGFATHSN